MRFGVDISIPDSEHCDHHVPEGDSDVVELRVDISLEQSELVAEGQQRDEQRVAQKGPRVVLHDALDRERVVGLRAINLADSLRARVRVEGHVERNPVDEDQSHHDHPAQEEVVPLEGHARAEVVGLFEVEVVLDSGVRHDYHQHHLQNRPLQVRRVEEGVQVRVLQLVPLPVDQEEATQNNANH